MSRNEVIEAYVVDVLRRLPGKDRSGIGFELRGLLTDMLGDREQAAGRAADDAMVLAVLREFGTPTEVAARYRTPGMVIIPPEQTRVFVPLAIAGVALQWALTLPRVFDDLPLSAWWLSWGLGSLWWPGFLVMIAMIGAWLRQSGLLPASDWTARVYDPERVNRPAMVFGLVGFACGVALMVSLPWLTARMAEPMPRIFAFDPQFLAQRAWLAIPLWLGSFASMVYVLVRGRWSTMTRHLELGFGLAFVLLMGWWIAAGPMFVAKPTDDGARLALGLVIFFMLIDLVQKALRQGVRIRTPRSAG